MPRLHGGAGRSRALLTGLVGAVLCSCSGVGSTPGASAPVATAGQSSTGSTPRAAVTPSPVPTPPPPTPGADGRLPNLETAQIYSGNPPDLTGYDPSHIRVVVATGDFVPARVTNALLVGRNAFATIWKPVAPLLHSGDVTLMNLGDPLLDHCPVSTTGFQFCGDDRIIAAMMATAGPVVVTNVANNHITNYGPQGLDETVAHLSAAGSQVSGFERIPVVTVRGVRLAFVGLDFVAHRPTRELMAQEIAAARGMADIVVAQIHAGKEYETYPQTGLSEDPKVLDHLAVDDGADVVIGNFPHCAEGSEVYRGKLIAYAGGNFLFDQDWSVGTQESALGRYYFADGRLVGVQYIPMRVVGQTTPTPLDPSTGEGRRILDRMARSSREIAGLQAPFSPDLSVETNACT